MIDNSAVARVVAVTTNFRDFRGDGLLIVPQGGDTPTIGGGLLLESGGLLKIQTGAGFLLQGGFAP